MQSFWRRILWEVCLKQRFPQTRNPIWGTWAAWGGGRTPVGVNTADTSFNTVEKTGGAKTHTLTVQEIPNHDHDLNAVNEGVDNPNGGYHPGWTFNKRYTAQVMSASTGGDKHITTCNHTSHAIYGKGQHKELL